MCACTKTTYISPDGIAAAAGTVKQVVDAMKAEADKQGVDVEANNPAASIHFVRSGNFIYGYVLDKFKVESAK